jgi:PPM family protein phosphatase
MSLGRTAGLTDTGRKRRHNEDSFVLSPPVFAIADGMGGANAGEVASGLAVEALREAPSGDGDGEGRVVSLIQEANRRVYERALEDAAASGMGTTMTLALLEEDTVRIGHVGDSRAYLIRDGELEQLTEDHSLVGGLVRLGKLTPQEAEQHPQRSVILRAVGVEASVEVDVDPHDLEDGDVYLLCSDGLTGMVPEQEILRVVTTNDGNLQKACQQLIDAANERGGLDNVTAVLVRTI